jgi:hypothetical protein
MAKYGNMEAKGNQTSFKPGQGGRKTGSYNKITLEQKERVEWVLGLLDETLEESISMLKPKEKVDLWLSLQEYIRPKLQRMNVDISPAEDRITKIIFEVVPSAMIPEANLNNLPIGEDSQGIRSIPEKL